MALGLMVSDKIFQVSRYLSLCKACDPRGGAILGTSGIIWKNLVDDH